MGNQQQAKKRARQATKELGELQGRAGATAIGRHSDVTSNNVAIYRNFGSGGYPALDTGFPLPVNISYEPRMATLSDRFRGAVDELLGGHTNSAVPMEEIILLSKSADIGGTAAASGADDSTEALLGALKWGLRQYGLVLYSGYRFFHALARLGSMLPNTFRTVNTLRISERIHRGPDGEVFDESFLPRQFCSWDDQVGEEGLNSLTSQIVSQVSTAPIGLTVLRIGFSSDFAVPCAVVLVGHGEAVILEPPQGMLPVVLVRGRFGDLSGGPSGPDLLSRATNLLEGGVSGVELLQRDIYLGELPRAPRAIAARDRIRVGASIGPAVGPESKGSAALYVRATANLGKVHSSQLYLLTAAHVVKDLPMNLFENYSKPLPDSVENVELVGVTTPGRLDILKRLHQLKELGLLNPTTAGPWVHAAEQACGYVVAGRLGTDASNWREDWALISLSPSLCGANGQWHKLEEFLVLACSLDKRISSTNFRGHVIGAVDLQDMPNKLCFKDGATTGWTAGQVNTRKAEIFVKGSTYPVEHREEVHEENIVRSFVEVIQSSGGSKGPFAKSGDSGSGIYAVTEDSQNFVFCGMVIGLFTPEIGDALVFAVPQSRVFSQIQAFTGVEWVIAV